MTCPDTDYLRELDLLDFCTEEPAISLPALHQPFNMVRLPLPSYPFHLQQHLPAYDYNYNFNYNYNFEMDDHDLFLDALEPPVQMKQESLLDIEFGMVQTGKRARPSSAQSSEAQIQPEQLEEPETKKSKKSATQVSALEASDLKFKTKQKRTKWMRKEVQALWEGIATYGNNWRLIKKKAFSHRTYYQVKDKGRRILSSQGWSSGRTKATHDGASEEAKVIAEKVLTLARNGEFVLEEECEGKDSITGSNTSNDEIDFEIDF